jgi:Holliday junction DNA helicase RuvA
VIARLTGRVLECHGEGVLLEVGGVGYDVMLPAHTLLQLHAEPVSELTLHTIQYLEGQPGGAHLTPRLLGFITRTDRTLFEALTRIKGISMRKALRAMSVPTAQLAQAIEAGDVGLLKSLPEIGKTTATRLVTELQGKLADVVGLPEVAAPVTTLNDAQLVAVEILVQWGDRRADAERWVTAAVHDDPRLKEADAIVTAAYRAKQQAR